jgi:hypothetical protein
MVGNPTTPHSPETVPSTGGAVFHCDWDRVMSNANSRGVKLSVWPPPKDRKEMTRRAKQSFRQFVRSMK